MQVMLTVRNGITAHEFLCSITHVPCGMNGNKPVEASKSERRRWLENKAVIINGMRPEPDDEVTFPITELVFFPNSQRKCTMVGQ